MWCAQLGVHDPIEGDAQDAVELLCTCESLSTVLWPSGAQHMPTSVVSSVTFLRRAPSSSSKEGMTEGMIFIPTPHPISIFEERRCKLANKESLKLFCALRSHALTRTPAGWSHEESMHRRLGMGGVALRIFRGAVEKVIQPSTHLLPGTLAGLKKADISNSFYWIPSVANFPGVDSILGDTDGQVYIIQATISYDHKIPIVRIRKVWQQFSREVRTQRTWHYVVVTETRQAAESYAEEFSEIFLSLELDHTLRTSVQLWWCALYP